MSAENLFGYSPDDLRDILCLRLFDNKPVDSMYDLISWIRPHNPEEAMHMGLRLIEARKKYHDEACNKLSGLISNYYEALYSVDKK